MQNSKGNEWLHLALMKFWHRVVMYRLSLCRGAVNEPRRLRCAFVRAERKEALSSMAWESARVAETTQRPATSVTRGILMLPATFSNSHADICVGLLPLSRGSQLVTLFSGDVCVPLG